MVTWSGGRRSFRDGGSLSSPSRSKKILDSVPLPSSPHSHDARRIDPPEVPSYTLPPWAMERRKRRGPGKEASQQMPERGVPNWPLPCLALIGATLAGYLRGRGGTDKKEKRRAGGTPPALLGVEIDPYCSWTISCVPMWAGWR